MRLVVPPLSRRLLELSPVTRYAAAVGAAVVAVAFRLAFDSVWGTELPYITLFPAIVLSAWLGGLWAGLVTTAICALAAEYFWIEPTRTWSLLDKEPGAWFGLVVFSTIGVVISVLNEAWRRGTRAAAESEERAHEARVAMERARRHAEIAAEQLRVALEAGRMGTWEYTMATGTVTWSSGLEVIHGFEPGRFPGTFEAFQREIHPDDRDRVVEAIRSATGERREHHVEYRIVRTDGAVRWVEGRGKLFLDEHGNAERLVGVCLDITERKAVEEARAALVEREQAARAEIERASRLKDEFLAGLSHELRTPLNAVLGYAQLLQSGTLSPERAGHAVEAIERNAKAQARLVESLLDLSRIMAGRLELELQPLDLPRVVDAAIEAIRPDADARGVTLDIAVPPLRTPLLGDGGRLQQVFWNLLTNAIKFTPRGGRVTLRAAERDGRVHIEVADTGQGISADFLPHVFDRFRQAEAGSRHARGGLGLGLALVHEMVQAHGGHVSAESQGEGCGSTFRVTLPLTVALPVEAGQPSLPAPTS